MDIAMDEALDKMSLKGLKNFNKTGKQWVAEYKKIEKKIDALIAKYGSTGSSDIGLELLISFKEPVTIENPKLENIRSIAVLTIWPENLSSKKYSVDFSGQRKVIPRYNIDTLESFPAHEYIDNLCLQNFGIALNGHHVKFSDKNVSSLLEWNGLSSLKKKDLAEIAQGSKGVCDSTLDAMNKLLNKFKRSNSCDSKKYAAMQRKRDFLIDECYHPRFFQKRIFEPLFKKGLAGKRSQYKFQQKRKETRFKPY